MAATWAALGWGVAVLGWGAAVLGWGAAVLGWGAAVLGWGVAVLGWGAAALGWGVAALGPGTVAPEVDVGGGGWEWDVCCCCCWFNWERACWRSLSCGPAPPVVAVAAVEGVADGWVVGGWVALHGRREYRWDASLLSTLLH